MRDLAINYAKNALAAYFGLEPLWTEKPKPGWLWEPRGVFVTLKIRGDLRGCLGDIETDTSLYQSIQELTVLSATKDPRFAPVTKEELAQIEIEISVLTKPKKITSWQQIKLGQHGVIVENGGHKGVFLPQVATEGRFTLESFLKLLCSQKAGLPEDAYKDPKTTLKVFEVEIIKDKS